MDALHALMRHVDIAPPVRLLIVRVQGVLEVGLGQRLSAGSDQVLRKIGGVVLAIGEDVVDVAALAQRPKDMLLDLHITSEQSADSFTLWSLTFAC